MFLWTSSILLFFFSALLLGREFSGFFVSMKSCDYQKIQKALTKAIHLFRELEETLLTGMVPDQERWDAVKKLPSPWGPMGYETLSALRTQGGSLLPTLKRLRSLAEEQHRAVADSRNRTSQAFAQAWVCAALVPFLGYALYSLVPGIERHLLSWLFACGLAFGLTALAALWLVHLAENARWGGLPAKRRTWILQAQCTGERFLAFVRCGTPPDLAWSQAIETLRQETLDLAKTWGHSIWETPKTGRYRGIEKAIIVSGEGMKKAIQISLLEGKACTERVESALQNLQKDIQSQIDRELSLLSTKALKPLFICVAPALLGLLIYGLWLTAHESLGGSDFGF